MSYESNDMNISTTESIEPIFLFSLPRSGSTLVQRILGASDAIKTVSEPWVLLSILANTSASDVYAKYYHKQSVRGVKDFISKLPRGKEDYDEAVRDFVLDLYSKAASKESIYFLDKTPRYHIVSDRIIDLFPNGKFIFLWRNPLSVIASMIETWGEGKWNLYRLKVDLFIGLEQLLQTLTEHKDEVWHVRYEDLITDEDSWKNLFGYLDLAFDKSFLGSLDKVQLEGRYGDQTGTKEYQGISKEPLHKWRNTLRNPVRKCWARRYLKWIGSHRLNLMGYNLENLLADLNEVQPSYEYVFSDLGRMTIGSIRPWIEPQLFKEKIKKMPAMHRVVEHK